ncbi:MAG: hypothetical protein KGN00_02025 [Chloroflexota bacterium]|nr:hypothetical protein [Chloroflexota bacterium]MDE3192443.1 hypothetical protein [Chloroflexota bacterium]
MRRARRVGLLAAAATVTAVIAALAGAAVAGARADVVTHVVVMRGGSGDAAARRVEYWIDPARDLARSVEATPDGAVVHATGSDWVLDLPPTGAGTLYRTAAAGEPPTREVTGRLDAIRASRSTTTKIVLEESLRGDGFPASFFADRGGRRVDETTETTLSGAAALAHMPLYALPGARSTSLEKVLYTRFASDRTLEQVHELYAADIQVTVDLLPGPVTLDRPGATDVETFAGAGKLYREAWGAQVLVSRGDVVYGVNAPSERVARSVALALRPVAR